MVIYKIVILKVNHNYKNIFTKTRPLCSKPTFLRFFFANSQSEKPIFGHL